MQNSGGMLINRYVKILAVLILILLLFASLAIAPSNYDNSFSIEEGDFAEIEDGYYLNVLDVDTYNDVTRFTITYYGTVLLDSHYYTGSYFYFNDEYLEFEFKVKDTYSVGYTDYVEISEIYSSVNTATGNDAYTNRETETNYTNSDEDASGILVLLLLVAFILLMRKRSKKKRAEIRERNAKKSASAKPGNVPATAAPVISPEKNVVIKSAIQYKGATILYKIKVENQSSEPIGDIKVTLLVPDVFNLKDEQKNISMLQTGESKTATFNIRPTGECGNCIISGKISYYDYNQKKHVQFDLSNKMVDILCPVLKIKEIDEISWRNATGQMLIAEENTKDLEIPAENLFDITTRILKDMNLYMISPEVTSTPQLYTGAARFYAEGVAGLKYAAYVEVVGKRKSRLIVKAWAEKEEALTGFYHKILQDIEKRTDINLFVDDSLNQYNINKTTIQDSIIQRSNIGADKKKCPKCGREVEGREKFCMNCGQKLD